MVSTYPSAVFHRERPAGGAGHSIARVSLNVFPVVPENTTLGANRFARRLSKEQRRQDCPAAIGGLIEIMFSSVNAFSGGGYGQKGLFEAFKTLPRLNFQRSRAKGATGEPVGRKSRVTA
jgi:hypothetical protein